MLAMELLQCNRNQDQGSVASAMKKVLEGHDEIYCLFGAHNIYLLVVHDTPPNTHGHCMSSLGVIRYHVVPGAMWYS